MLLECNVRWFRVPSTYLTLGFREVVSYVAFRIFNNLHLINDEAWFDSHPRLQLIPACDFLCRDSLPKFA